MKTEVWMVIQKRQDGKLPDPVKMMYVGGYQGLQYTEEDAVEAMHAINSHLGGEYAGVFRCVIEVCEDKTPNTK